MVVRHGIRQIAPAMRPALLIVLALIALTLGACAATPTVAPADTPTPPRIVATWTMIADPTPPPATATRAATQTPPPPAPSATPTTLPATATSLPAPTGTSTPTVAPTFTASPAPPVATRPAPTASPTVVALKERIWDARLTKRGATLIPAQAQPGQGYWRLVQAQWFDVEDEPFAGKHHIFIDFLDAAGVRLVGVPARLAAPDARSIYGYVGSEAKPGEPYAANFAMSDIAPAYRVEPADGAPADAVTGLGLGSIELPNLAMLTSYGFTWQWTIAGQSSAAPATTGGMGPDSALAVPATRQHFAIGQRIWYAFHYAGDSSPIMVEMSVSPPPAANFAIWTPNDLVRWKQDNRESPVGRGAPNAGAGGALVWTGNFNEAGVYYIVVDQTGPYSGSFVLSVSGTAVARAGQGQ